MYTPPVLQQAADQIRELNIYDQEVSFNRDAWQKEIIDLEGILNGINGDALSRQNIFGIFPDDPLSLVPCDQDQQQELTRFFVLVMIWGYGNVGTGPWRVRKMIETPDFSRILCEVSQYCYYGLFLKAFERLLAINRLGPAFASKYLYFYCKNFNASIKPLIVDSVVLAEMNRFGWPPFCMEYLSSSNGERQNPKKQAKAYGQYLILLHNWAVHLHCTPDQIEYFLWSTGMYRGR